MSHFTVLVIGKNIEDQLQPFHEFECTGENDQYVVEVDETEEARETYEKSHQTRYQLPDGTITTCYDEEGNYKQECLRWPTAEEAAAHRDDPLGLRDSSSGDRLRWSTYEDKVTGEYVSKIFELPPDWTAIEVRTKDHETFAEWIEGYYGHKVVPFGEQPDLGGEGREERGEHKYGYTIVDEAGEVVKTINRTNPNKQWDWYQIGGRWNGFFKLKADAVPADGGMIGEPSLLDLHSKGYEPPAKDRADSARKGDIDIAGMRDEAGFSAGERYDNFAAVVAEAGGPAALRTWKSYLEEYGIHDGTVATTPGGIEAARKAYHNQPAYLALRKDARTSGIWEYDEYAGMTREAYVQLARDGAIATFAVLLDGVWYERGDMGWWGCVGNEKDKDRWYTEFVALIDGVPDDTLLTIVDCHI